MWRLILVVFFWNGVHGWQTDPPPELDDEMKSLIQQVEGTEDPGPEVETKSVEEPHGLTFKTDAERALYQRAADYLESCAAGDWETSYGFFWKPYREVVSLSSYFKQEKASINRFRITQVGLSDEFCGFVRANYGIENSMMDLKKIRARQKWHLEEGEWYLIADPYANMMGLRPPGVKKIEIPCSFPRPNPAKTPEKPETASKKES